MQDLRFAVGGVFYHHGHDDKDDFHNYLVVYARFSHC